MYYLIVHPDARSDLAALRQADQKAAAVILARLHELQCSPDLLDRLSQDRFGVRGRDKFSVRALLSQIRAGNNLWRLRIWELEGRSRGYRVIYAFLPAKKQYHVLGIMPREIDYDRENDFIRRVEHAYDDIRDGRW